MNDAPQLPEPPAIVAPLEAVPIWTASPEQWAEALSWSALTGFPPWLFPLFDEQERTFFVDHLLPESPDA